MSAVVSRIKSLIFDNFLIKIVSFLVAVGLWLYVTSKGDLEASFMIPLELRNTPPSMVVVSDVPDYLNVRLKGRHSAIRAVNASQIRVVLDLSQAKSGENHYTLTDDSVNVPSSVEVSHISPRVLSLRLMKMDQKEVPVRVETTGSPAPGFHVARVMLNPARVKIEGPESEIRNIGFLSVTAVRLQGEKETFSREARVEPQSRNIRVLDPQTVMVMVVIKKRL